MHGSRPRTPPWSILFQPSCQAHLPGSQLASPIDLSDERNWWLLDQSIKNISQQSCLFLGTYQDKVTWTRELHRPQIPSHQCGPGGHIELGQMVGHHRWWGCSRLAMRPQCPAESNQYLILVCVSVFQGGGRSHKEWWVSKGPTGIVWKIRNFEVCSFLVLLYAGTGTGVRRRYWENRMISAVVLHVWEKLANLKFRIVWRQIKAEFSLYYNFRLLERRSVLTL